MDAIFSFAFAISLFFSADFLTIFGNSIGKGGIWFLGLLILVFAFHSYTAKSYSAIYSTNKDLNDEYSLICQSLGGVTGFIFPFLAKALLTVCMGVGLLATAGYAFNELFVRWFPNMGFTLLILGILLLISLAGPRLVRVCQLVFSGATILGMLVLSAIGLASYVDSSHTSGGFSFFQIEEMAWVLSCFVLLMGFEMAKVHDLGMLQESFSIKRMTVTGLISGFIVLFLWGVVTLTAVSPERISETYIPHLITARAISGLYGRKIMGLIIIFGSLAAVNALLHYVSGIAGEVLSKELTFRIDKKRYTALSVIFLVFIIAGLLISGMAGEPEFENYIKGGIYLWLLNYGVVHFALYRMSRIPGERETRSLPLMPYFSLVYSLFIYVLYFGLVLTDHEAVSILRFTGTMMGGALLSYIFYRGIYMKLAQ
jgi:hypothetical protein